jgi:hypothetical protein
MTNLEALQAKVGYPLATNTFILALINRGLSQTETYVAANMRLLELSQADCLKTLISSPNVSEGGYSLSASDKASIRKLADCIYSKWGESQNVSNPVIRDLTDRW